MVKKWRQLRHLLLFAADEGDPATLQPALDRLRQALSETRLTLWTREEHLASAGQLAGPAKVLGGPRAWLTEPDPLIALIREEAVDAALIFSAPECSPYTPAYICYLAGVPVRIGQSLEFGGRVLSHQVRPAFPLLAAAEHHLHLVEEAGLEEVQAAPVAPQEQTDHE